jgi:hypothetical protein
MWATPDAMTMTHFLCPTVWQAVGVPVVEPDGVRRVCAAAAQDPRHRLRAELHQGI